MSNTAEDLPIGYIHRDAYLQWVNDQPTGRFERIDGQIVAMAPERAIHADRKALAWLALHRAITNAKLPCHVYPDGMTVAAGDGNDYEPDAILRCGEPLPDDSVYVPDPLVVVEVLSPSTRGGDLTRKLVGYFQVPSIRHYLILFADRPQIIHHQRRDHGDGFDTQILTSGEISLSPPGVTISVDEIYVA